MNRAWREQRLGPFTEHQRRHFIRCRIVMGWGRRRRPVARNLRVTIGGVEVPFTMEIRR